MSQNPYATPATPTGSIYPQNPGPARSGTIDVGEALSEAWRALTDQWVVGVFGMILYLIMSLISLGTCVGIFLLLPIFAWGYNAMMLNMLDGDAEIGDLFSGFNRYGEALASVIVFWLCLFALSLPSTALSVASDLLDVPSLWYVGQLLNIVITLFVTTRLYFGLLYVVDQGMGGYEAIRASWEATQGQQVSVILLLLVSFLVAMTGVVALFIGIFFTAPLASLVYVAAYRQLEPVHQPAQTAFQASTYGAAGTTAPNY